MQKAADLIRDTGDSVHSVWLEDLDYLSIPLIFGLRCDSKVDRLKNKIL